MKTSVISHIRHRLRLGFLFVALCAIWFFTAPTARAGLTFEVHVVRFGQGQTYKFFTPLYTNSTAPLAPFGNYFIYSPQQPTNGSWREIQVTAGGANTVAGVENFYPNFNSVMQQITNGTWNVLFTNSTTTNHFTFTVSAPNVTSNMLPATIITFPLDGALNISNAPTFTWQGPKLPLYTTNTYVRNYDFSFYEPVTLPPGQTNWTVSPPLPNGLNGTFNLSYITNYPASIFVATTPLNTNASHQAISEWDSISALETDDSINFAVTNPPSNTTTLIAYYTFDDSGNLGHDSSGNGYDLDFNGGNGVTSTNDARVGSGAAYFDGGSFFSYNSTPGAVLNAFAGDFSLSFWIKTTQDDGHEGGKAYAGDGIVALDVSGLAFDSVPAALDGGEIGFNTGFFDDTLNSQTDVNDGNYHHVVVTRNQTTGEKQIYIDGVLDNSQFATMNPLSDPHLVAIGCAIDASQTDPNNANPGEFFQGSLDDLQIYAGVLSSNQVAQLYANTSPALVAHYTFDNSGNLGQDSSGHGYDLDFNGGNGVTSSGDAKAGSSAANFDGGSFLSYNSTPSAVLSALASDFSLSFWIKTGAFNDNEGGFAFNGAGIVSADVSGLANDLVPAALDGGEIGFNTGGDFDTTINSTTDINQDGNYHHVVITRNQATGERRIYIDGLLNNSDIATMNMLTNPVLVAVGCAIDASQADPNNANTSNFFQGLLDDIQLYSVILSSNQVAQLYANPGSTVSTGPDLSPALNTTNLTWITGGDASWFIETTTTHDSVSAAQSGLITDGQASELETTVPTDGQVSFYWKVSSEENFDYLHFYINGEEKDAISGEVDWNQETYSVSAGDVLRWEYTKDPDCCSGGLDAGFLDQVSFVASGGPVITLNPFDQTNYPGYNVALLAAATSNDPITWEWFKVGDPSPISNATNALYIPANSGVAGVAGSYYAIATDINGSANTTTAAVNFVSATLLPGWSRAVGTPYHAEFDTNVIKDYYGGCVVDSAGEVYVADQYVGNVIVRSNFITLNTLTAVGTNGGAALVKYDASGNPLWAIGLTNNQISSSSYAVCVALAPGNGAYLASSLTGTNWLGANQYVNKGGNSILLSRFDANGSNVWSRLIGQTNQVFTRYNTLVSDSSGNVTIGGVINGTADFGGINLAAPGFMGFLAQYNANGTLLWAQLLPTFPRNLAYGGGRLYVSLPTTVSSGITNVSIGNLSNITDRAWAVACLTTTNGQAFWLRGVGEQYGAKTINGNVTDDIPLISVSGSDMFLTGTAYGSNAVFGGLTVSLPGGRYQYFARYDTNGNAQVATSYGSATTMPWASTANSSGVYVSGDFDNYSQFGNALIAASVNGPSYLGSGYFTQPFVAKFDRDGNPLWARNGMGSALANFRGIATTSDGVWASGIVLLNDIFHPAQFGTNTVFSDGYIDDFGTGIIFLFTQGGLLAKITEVLPVTILSPAIVGTNFQFSFVSSAGYTNTVESRTNLALGSWQFYTNFTGDGTLKTVLILKTNPPVRFFRVTTQ